MRFKIDLNEIDYLVIHTGYIDGAVEYFKNKKKWLNKRTKKLDKLYEDYEEEDLPIYVDDLVLGDKKEADKIRKVMIDNNMEPYYTQKCIAYKHHGMQMINGPMGELRHIDFCWGVSIGNMESLVVLNGLDGTSVLFWHMDCEAG